MTIAGIIKLNKVSTAVMNAIADPEDGEILVNTDTETLWYYEDGDSLWHDSGASGSTESAGYSSGSISATGTTTLTLGANDLIKTTKLTVTAPAGAYTHIVVLSTTNANAGDRYEVIALVPASAVPTIEVRNATSGGTLLQSLNNIDAAEALQWSGVFVYDGSAWGLAHGGYHAS